MDRVERGLFRDRRDAGRQLAALLARERGPDLTVLALPRGGVPVAYEVARALGAPLDVLVVRKLGLPGHPELAMGALAPSGLRVMNAEVLRRSGVSEAAVEAVAAQEAEELRRREAVYRAGLPPLQVTGQRVLLIDDGLATGATMRAAVRALRRWHPARLTVAVPVGAPETCAALRREADEVVCLTTPTFFAAVGQAYARFEQTGDDEVRDLLALGRAALR